MYNLNQTKHGVHEYSDRIKIYCDHEESRFSLGAKPSAFPCHAYRSFWRRIVSTSCWIEPVACCVYMQSSRGVGQTLIHQSSAPPIEVSELFRYTNLRGHPLAPEYFYRLDSPTQSALFYLFHTNLPVVDNDNYRLCGIRDRP